MCCRHLAGADVCFQEGLNDTLVVDKEVDHGGVNHVIMCAQPRDSALEGSYFCIKGGGCEDPLDMFGDDLSSLSDD